MFCQSCGFEYTQKTNYCKRCGGNLTSTDKPPVVQLPTLKITGVFFVIAEPDAGRGVVVGSEPAAPFGAGFEEDGVVIVHCSMICPEVIIYNFTNEYNCVKVC